MKRKEDAIGNLPKRNLRKPISKKKQTKSLIWSMKKADEEFSRWIRARDRVCARCGKTPVQATCSHFWPRQHKATRYDPDNCVMLCWMPCHKYQWEKEKQGDYRVFMLRWLGSKRYDALEFRARSVMPLKTAIIDCMRLIKGV